MSMADNPPSIVDEGAFTVRRTIRIAAPIDKVWSAVTEPAHISQWFGKTDLNGRDAGSAGTFTFSETFVVPVQIEAIDEPRMVSYRWGNGSADGSEQLDDARSTVFTFNLEPIADGTQLTVVETGFENMPDPLATLEDHREGWDTELDKLVALLEGAS